MGVKGVTLTELLVVIGILVVLLSLSTIGFRHLTANYNLTDATNQLYSDLEWARQKSLGNAHRFGIQFTPNSYTIFEDQNDNNAYDTGEELETRNLNNITLSGYPANNRVLFTRKGTPSQSFTLTLTHNNGKTKQISVSIFKIRIQ